MFKECEPYLNDIFEKKEIVYSFDKNVIEKIKLVLFQTKDIVQHIKYIKTVRNIGGLDLHNNEKDIELYLYKDELIDIINRRIKEYKFQFFEDYGINYDDTIIESCEEFMFMYNSVYDEAEQLRTIITGDRRGTRVFFMPTPTLDDVESLYDDYINMINKIIKLYKILKDKMELIV